MPDCTYPKQVEDMRRRVKYGAVFFLTIFLLSACGKMATELDTPDGQDAPLRTYPDPSTDPKP